jgi:hypothetical protein
MRKLLLLFGCAAFIISCSSNKNKEKTASAQQDNTAPQTSSTGNTATPSPRPLEKFLGSFVGPFGDNKITLLVTKLEGDSVVGRTIVGGNDRPFRGTFKKEGALVSFNAKEPGDHKDDGEFNFSIDEGSPDILKGNWKPFAKNRPAKDFELQRKQFAYRTDVGDYPEASQRLLKAEDVENLMKEDLEFMRNEIFARHGYCFNKKYLRQQFELQDWYVPNTVDIKGYLTEIEKKNIAMIKRYEKYAEEYGDEYGR